MLVKIWGIFAKFNTLDINFLPEMAKVSSSSRNTVSSFTRNKERVKTGENNRKILSTVKCNQNIRFVSRMAFDMSTSF